MNEQSDPIAKPPTAAIRSSVDRRRRLSFIWAIPIVTVLVGLWLAWNTLSQRGPEITITFETAEGLTAGQSHVRHKDVDMGMVTNIALSEDLQHVLVTVRMNRESRPFLTDRAKFWVVKPRFFAGSVTGLQTLVSGAYVELLPSPAGGTPERDFVGLENPPVLQSDVPGHTFLLKAPRIGSLSLGSPVFFRDLAVGQVLGWDLDDMAKSVTIHAFVRSPFDQYVRESTRFWNASGASVNFGANGLQVELESLRALVLGGIAFESPENPTDSPAAAENHNFPLYANKEAADAATYTRRVPMVAMFNGSVADLKRGAPVTLHGIKIGEVSSVNLSYDRTLDVVVVPVHFEVEPERIEELHLPTGGGLDNVIRDLVHHGLQVRIESTSLITGQKQLALEFAQGATSAEYAKLGDTYVIPAAEGSGDLATEASTLLSRVNAIPFEQIGEDLSTATAGLSQRVNDPQLKEAVASLQETLTDARELVQRLNSASEPLLQRMPAIARDLESATRRLNSLAGSLESGYGGNSELNRNASRMLVQLTDAAQSIRVLADLLSRHPEALLRGRTAGGLP